MEQMIGSYGPKAEPHTVTFHSEDAPSGMLARAKYDVKSKIIDDDKYKHAGKVYVGKRQVPSFADCFRRTKNSNGASPLPRSGKGRLGLDDCLSCFLYLPGKI